MTPQQVTRVVLHAALGMVGAPLALFATALAALRRLAARRMEKPRLLWGTTPIRSLKLLSTALKRAGYHSETVVLELYGTAAATDFDHLLFSPGRKGRLTNFVLRALKSYWFFSAAVFRYDIFHYFFDGGILRHTALGPLELRLLRFCGKRIVLFPYGSDAFVYDTITNPILKHALMTSYARHGNEAARLQARIRRATALSDAVLSCLVHHACLPRWDVLPLTCYPVDVEKLQPQPPRTEGPIRIAHAANHRGVKGTEFLLDAVARLRREGHEIELDVIEGVSNEVALGRIARADLFVDQLVVGYALAALEGMALGKVVVSAIERTPDYELFRTYSYLDECPIVPATQRDIYDVLRSLIARRPEWPEIGARSRDYVERRHSFDSHAEMFEAIYDRIWWGRDVDLINFFHPLGRRGRGYRPPARAAGRDG